MDRNIMPTPIKEIIKKLIQDLIEKAEDEIT